MKKIILAFFAITAFHAALLAQLTIKDPNAQVRDARNFHGVSVGSAFDVVLVQGNEDAVAVSASEAKYRDLITVEVKDGILHIGLQKSKWNFGDRKLKAYISFRNLDKLDISGACNARIEGTLKANDLKVDLSGASDLQGKLEVDKLSINLSGASDMKVNGTVSRLTIDASGASKFKGFDLATDYCNAEASGASDIKITVNKELSVRASGASDVDYKGEGVIRELKTSGASSVARES
ncbi:MAG: head GIN domain-containing protein [Chitinophagaceae bacterium]